MINKHFLGQVTGKYDVSMLQRTKVGQQHNNTENGNNNNFLDLPFFNF